MKIGSSLGTNGLNQAQQQQQTQQQRLASAQRINSAKDDAAGLAISTRMNSESRGLAVAIRNSGDAISRLQTEDGAIQTLQEDVQRIRELELQASNGILNQQDRDALQAEITQRRDNIQQTLEQSEFNGRAIFSNQDPQTLTFQVGPDAGNTLDVTEVNLQQGFSDADLSLDDAQSFDLANLSTDKLDSVLSSLVERRTELGAVSNRLDANVANLATKQENVEQANSRIADTDFAKAVSEKVRADILTQVGISTQAQANEDQRNVLNLLK